MTLKSCSIGLTAVAAVTLLATSVVTDAQTKPACPTSKPMCPTSKSVCDKEVSSDCPDVKKWCGAKVKDAVCVIRPTEGNAASGIVRFTATDEGVKMVADIQGLKPGSQHGFHIHQYGDCSMPNGKSAGGHYNPKNSPHGLTHEAERHAGDLGNITADDQGSAHYEITLKNIVISGPGSPIIGRGMIVHAKPDDGGQPTGNAGARIGCGVIGIAKTDG